MVIVLIIHLNSDNIFKGNNYSGISDLVSFGKTKLAQLSRLENFDLDKSNI